MPNVEQSKFRATQTDLRRLGRIAPKQELLLRQPICAVKQPLHSVAVAQEQNRGVLHLEAITERRVAHPQIVQVLDERARSMHHSTSFEQGQPFFDLLTERARSLLQIFACCTESTAHQRRVNAAEHLLLQAKLVLDRRLRIVVEDVQRTDEGAFARTAVRRCSEN